MRRERRAARRRERNENRKPLRERIMTILTWSGFLGGLLKHSVNLPAFVAALEVFAAAPVEQKWETFKPVGDIVWPVAVDLIKFSAQEYDVHALEAQFEAQAIDIARLKQLWDVLSPILLPLLLEFIKGKK